jgi:hypothetical protein
MSLDHPNIVRFYGILRAWSCWSPVVLGRDSVEYELALVSEYLPHLDVLTYCMKHPELSAFRRLALVSVP